MDKCRYEMHMQADETMMDRAAKGAIIAVLYA
jgi:hypothetical protein